MLYNILKPLHVTIDGEHHDTLRQDYPGCFSYFANFYGTVRWRDTTTPRTDAPVRFMYSLSNAYTYRQARSKPTGSGKAFLGYPA